jgi:hypothetical protein
VKRWKIAVLLGVACSVSAAAGFWTGFREAWILGSAADLLPRAARSVTHLELIERNNLDNGLLWAYELMNHPLRRLWSPLWGLEVYPDYERYLTRIADYRRDHPSSIGGDAFTNPPSPPDTQETLRNFNREARDVAARRDAMVKRYATPGGVPPVH